LPLPRALRKSLGLKNIPAATAPLINITACCVRIFLPDAGNLFHGTNHGEYL